MTYGHLSDTAFARLVALSPCYYQMLLCNIGNTLLKNRTVVRDNLYLQVMYVIEEVMSNCLILFYFLFFLISSLLCVKRYFSPTKIISFHISLITYGGII